MDDTEITICSLNCQGLANFRKRRDVINYLRDYSIVCLQDTHISLNMQNTVRNEWGFQSYFSSFNSCSRGVAILSNKNVEFKTHSKTIDPKGNFIILDIDLLGTRTTLVTAYAPNKDNPMFFHILKNKIINLNNCNVILVGDWNLLKEPIVDGWNYKHLNNPKARIAFLEMIDELGMVDIWRDKNPTDRKYTWRRKLNNRIVQKGRLDSFIISDSLTHNIEVDCKILSGYRSDHSIITLSMRKGPPSRKYTFWKLNTSHLKNVAFQTRIKDKIQEVKVRYAAPVYNLDKVPDIDPKYYQSYLNPNTFLEVSLMEIRGECIRFSKELKKRENTKEQEIKSKIESIQQNIENESQEIELEQLKEELQSIREKRLEGALIRSRARWVKEGEKPSKYFCNLENRNYTSKSIRSLIVGANVIKNQKDIMIEIKEFYHKLYTTRDHELKDAKLETMLNQDTPRLDNERSTSLAGDVTVHEAYTVLKQFSNSKSPGTSGFPAEFYKTFWDQLKYILVNAMNYSYHVDRLPTSLCEGIITCLPKPGKDKHYIKNWRPISLLNVSYKILSGVIARRIQQVLPTIISEDQTGFMKNRFMGDNLRLMYDTLNYANVRKKRGMLILIDFEKAFDSVSWKFLINCLTYFNFPCEIIKWIMLCYKDGKSSINVNASISEWFPITRGCRQGDPLSPYLFLICGEILALLIKQNEKIKGYHVDGIELLISQYADDTSIFLDGEKESFTYCVQTILEYAKYSGLNMNFEKTNVLWFGPKKENEAVFEEYPKFNWNPTTFKILGIDFTKDLLNITDLNIQKQIINMENILNNWSNRYLTPLGKITVIKSLVNSKIVHILTALPQPSERIIKTLESMFYRFLWNNKPDKIKRQAICQPKENGGLAMINLRNYIKAIQLTWLRRFNVNNPRWKSIVNTLYGKVKYIQNFGSTYAYKIASSCDNQFWSGVLRTYGFYFDTIDKESQRNEERLFMYNNNFNIGKHPIYFKQLEQYGVFKIGQFKSNDTFMQYDEFMTVYTGIEMNYLNYMSLIQIFKTNQNDYKGGKEIAPWDLIMKVQKGARHIYNAINKNNEIPNGIKKWKESEFQTLQWRDLFSDLYNITSDNKLIWFQYRILHNILSTNRSVSKFIPEQTELCHFCKKHPEYISHLLFECEVVTRFWTDLKKIMYQRCQNIELELSKELIIMNTSQTGKHLDAVTKLIILMGKYHLYRCKVQNSKPCAKGLIKEIERVYKTEEINVKSKGFNDMIKFDLRWLKHKKLIQGLVTIV